jgi:hypothetical protein
MGSSYIRRRRPDEALAIVASGATMGVSPTPHAVGCVVRDFDDDRLDHRHVRLVGMR